jgi:hypothetical protein
MATEHEEDRLRQQLRDDGWSLPVWRDAEARVRRTARRQRLHTISASAVACALAAAAVVLPLRLTGTAPRQAPAGAGSKPVPAGSATSTTPGTASAAPPVGAPGFPADIYPQPRALPAANLLAYCPGGTDMQPFAKATGLQALAVLKRLGHTLARDLRLTDRAFWPIMLKERQGNAPGMFFARPPGPIQYQGPLVDYRPANGPPDLDGLIAQQCGAWLALSTWVIVTGPAGSPSEQSEMLFINRRGHVLMYYEQ